MEPVSDPRIYSRRYQVTHLIARGGMAMVYRAQDQLLNRAVALKILYSELSADPLFVERFRREAQAAANLSHPNIVPVFDWGEDDGTYFIVMELIDGTSLADVLRGSRSLTPSRSASIAAQVAAALGYAHRSGVVHRDVKPGNILITSDGQVKVTDFGIAQAVSSEDHLAEEGSVMGTATYFSPEQASGAPVDGRSDVYSLGVVLYEMVVGRPPFIGESPVAVSTQHVHGSVPPPSEFSDSIPADLEAIIMEALAKSPEQRYQTADELRADLLRFNEGQPVRAARREGMFFGADATRAVAAVAGGERTMSVPLMTGPRTDVRRRRKNRTGLYAAIVIVLLAVGGLAYFLSSGTKTVVMPNVVGETVVAATQQLKGDGLTIGATSSVKSKEPSGTVVSTDPKAGVALAKGKSVSLAVSLGQTTSPVTVPDVTGMPLSQAESTLQFKKLGFTVQFTTTVPPGGSTEPNTVLSQVPVGGTTDQTGDKVVITVLSPNAQFQVPSLANDTTLAAASTLGKYGLTVSAQTSSVCSNHISQGNVVSTLPTTGTLVKSGTAIELITSSGYCQVVVPTVTGQTQAAAVTTLQGDGLQSSVTDAPSNLCTDPTTAGTVVIQSVAGGSQALYDSTVDLQVCPLVVTTTTTGP